MTDQSTESDNQAAAAADSESGQQDPDGREAPERSTHVMGEVAAPHSLHSDAMDDDGPAPAYGALSQQVSQVFAVLNRDTPIGALSQLEVGLVASERRDVDTSLPFALGFDTNAFYRLGLNKNGPAAVDYLSGVHVGPVIVPGQVVQEIWNNSLSVVQPQARVLKKKFEELEVEAAKVDQGLGDAADGVRDAIRELIDVHGAWVDPDAKQNFVNTVATLAKVAESPFVPRVTFERLARIRDETKTPPGFIDTGYGDFFIWADFLLGLLTAEDPFEGVVFVTNDVKYDWSRDGVEHPVLVAEAVALTGKPFRLWTLAQFQKYAADATTA